jgi:hypothetical protein
VRLGITFREHLDVRHYGPESDAHSDASGQDDQSQGGEQGAGYSAYNDGDRPFDVELASDTPLCISDDGVCATWLPDARQECVDNYPLEIESPADQQAVRENEDCIFDLAFQPFQGITPSRFTGPLDSSVIGQFERLQKAGYDRVIDEPAVWIVAADVPEVIVIASKEARLAAEKYLGAYGPLTSYIIGNDLSAAETVIEEFCNRAWEGSMITYCIEEDQGPGMREMATIFPGGNAFQQSSWRSTRPSQHFVDNPCANEQNEFCAIAFPEELVYGQTVVAHEYFHVYQSAHQLYKSDNPSEIPPYPMPRWFEEGTASYFQMIIDENEGWSRDIGMSGHEAPRIRMLEESLDEISRGREIWPSLTLIDIETEASTQRVSQYCAELCIGFLQYGIGYVATALLADLTSDKALLFDFYDLNKTDGFYPAFEETFGMSVDEFYAELDLFLAQPFEEQMEALAPQ